MGGKPVGIVLLLLACAGCHACQNCYDYLPPVADGPHTAPGQRAGSAFGGPIYNGPNHEGPLPDPTLSESEVIDEWASDEDFHSAQISQTLRELLAIED